MAGWLAGWAVAAAWLVGCTASPERQREPERLTLLHTADLHSRLFAFRTRISRFDAEQGLGTSAALAEVAGVARLSTLLTEQRRRGSAVWLDSGDALEGAEVFAEYGGRPELELLSSLGLAAMALGNHELSLSAGALADLLRTSAAFPVLSANLVPSDDSALYGWLLPSVVLDIDGLALGVVGLSHAGSPPALSAPSNAWGLTAMPPLAAVQSAIDALNGRAQLVVVVSHVGLEQDRALVAGTTGIDLVLGGHQHILTAEPEWQTDCESAEISAERECVSRPVPIVHSGAYGQWLSRIELRLERAQTPSGRLAISDVKVTHVPASRDVPEDPAVAAVLESVRPAPRPPLAWLPDALQRRAALGGDAPLGNVVTDAVRRATGADVVLLNSSGLRGDWEAGVLLRSDLELAFPFEEPWRLLWVTGSELRAGLEQALYRGLTSDCRSPLQVSGLRLGVRCELCVARSAGCVDVSRAAAAVDDAARLLAAVPEYLLEPGAPLAAWGERGTALPAPVVPALLEFVRGLPPGEQGERCAEELEVWPASRCREAFGVEACPLGRAPATAACRALPALSGGRDDRIQMLP